MATYKSTHKGADIDSAVTTVLAHQAGIQGVKVDDTELTPDTDNKVNIDTTTFNIPAVVQVTGTSTTSVMSQDAVTTAIAGIDIPQVVQQTGTSTSEVMSQNAVTNALGDIPSVTVVQQIGTSTTSVMSQKAVTDSILNPNLTEGSRVRINSVKPLASGAAAVTIIDCDGTSEVGTGSVIVGGDIGNGATYSTSVGYGSTVYAMFGTAVGSNALAVASQCSAFGEGAKSNGAGSASFGSRAQCTSGTSYNTAIGLGATAQHNYAVAIGALSATTEDNAVSVGDGTSNATYGHRKIVNVKDPTNAQDAATKNYVDSKVVSFSTTLPYASWTGTSAPYTKAVTVTGILATDTPTIDLDLSNATYSDVATIQSSWANVYRAVTSADTITFYASSVPTIDIPLGIKAVR